jgi:hypothetical protein
LFLHQFHRLFISLELSQDLQIQCFAKIFFLEVVSSSDSLTFLDINLNQAISEGAKVVAFVLLRTPMTIGNETTTVIASTDFPLKSMILSSVPSLRSEDERPESTSKYSHEKQDWYQLFDPQSNVAILGDAGLQIKVKYLGNID